jgi:phage FluMu protein Com
MTPLGMRAQTQIRCESCNRRLADVVNAVEAGQAIVELKCPRCGCPHLEIVRAEPAGDPHQGSPDARQGKGGDPTPERSADREPR